MESKPLQLSERKTDTRDEELQERSVPNPVHLPMEGHAPRSFRTVARTPMQYSFHRRRRKPNKEPDHWTSGRRTTSTALIPGISQVLGAGRVDPFQSYPVPYRPWFPELVHQWTILSPDLPGIKQGYLKRDWLRMSLQEPALFYGVLLYPFSYVNGELHMSTLDESGPGSYTARRELLKLWLKGRALQETNALLQDPYRNKSDLAVAAVTGLTNFELRFGDPAAEEKHFNGLKAIVEARGGLEAANIGQGIDSLIGFLDKTRFMVKGGQGPVLTGSTARSTPSTADMPTPEQTPSANSASIASGLSAAFDDNTAYPSSRLHYTFNRLQNLMMNIESAGRGLSGSSHQGYSLFKEAETLYSTLTNLKNLTRSIDTSNDGDSLDFATECARIAALQTCGSALAYLEPPMALEVIETEFRQGTADDSSEDDMQLYLLNVSPTEFPQQTCAIYFWALLVIGSTVRQPSAELASKVYTTCLHLELLSWESVERMLLEFPYSKRLSHKACFDMWQSASPV
ncbi:MAG: hypothetical protein M1828_005111 [Chrysothrix sp. TS-e1954]|nr:MAG: hypothetical protein M1828_005111 [Chrysothrix sp. TS-e1954]